MNVSRNLQSPDAATRQSALDDITRIAVHATCFAQFDPDLSSHALSRFLAQGLNNSKQQSSPSGSSAATSAVSKPSGSTALVQDVGGFSATNNGSSLTFQFAPGDLVNQLASAGAFDYCTASLRTKGCVSPSLLKVFSPATFSVTTNTSTAGAQVTGNAMSSGAAVPATLASSGNTLTFGGVTAKYGFWYRSTSDSSNNGDSSPSTLTKSANALAGKLGNFTVELDNQCPATFGPWKAGITIDSFGGALDPDSVLVYVSVHYQKLLQLLKADSNCAAQERKLSDVLASISAYQAAIAAKGSLAGSKVPVLGLEYDYTTPANKPGYHSAKMNFTWQSKSSCQAQVATAAANALKAAGAKPLAPPKPGETAPSAISGCPDASPGGNGSNVSPNASAPSPNWTISASAGADIFSDAPSATIPSANRLRDVQAGAEITRVWHLSTSKSAPGELQNLLAAVGDLSLVGAYYYQDQTSPSILNGPPSSITFNGLPTTASQVFATRGPINVGQVRFGFGTGKNTTFPVAISYSNRSDLIVHPFFGVQFGVTYNLTGK